MTAGNRRKGSSKFGQADHNGNPGHDGNTGYHGSLVHDGNTGYHGSAVRDGNTGYHGSAVHDGSAVHENDASRETEQGRKAGRYGGRHSNALGKPPRKRVVPAAAVAAVIVGGSAAAYFLGVGGPPQAASVNEAMAAIGAHQGATTSAIGNASGSASTLIKVAKASMSSAARASAKHTATPAASHTSAASLSAAASSAAVSSPAAQSGAATHDTTASDTATVSAPATTQALAVNVAANSSVTSKPAAAATLSCNVNSGMLPDNVTAIVSFLVANGYSNNAAAGIAGNIYQESKGNPESVGTGGGGLIGWTPLRPGLITGNATADLQTQLSALLTYNQGWSQYLPALNAASSPVAAADIYVTDFERAGIPAASNREASAQNVATACGI